MSSIKKAKTTALLILVSVIVLLVLSSKKLVQMGGKLNNLLRLKNLHPAARAKFEQLIAYANLHGYSVVITSGFRTFAESKKLHAENAKNALISFHNMGCAIDINLTHDETNLSIKKASSLQDWKKTGLPDFAKSIGVRWGGDFKNYHDPIHFEFSKKSIQDIAAQGNKQSADNSKWNLELITV
jgi:hypothetical protein